jgi:hypothetical protein
MKNAVIFILTAIVLAGLFFILKPDAQIVENTHKTFSIEIRDKKIVSGTSEWKVTQNDRVTIKIKIDEEEEFHLHGYDRAVDVKPDTETELNFVANLTGRFEFELEKSKISLGALEVQPK